MTTLQELIEQAPAPSHGIAVAGAQLGYGSGVWRVALEVADPGQGVSVEWHDFPPAAIARLQWRRGSTEPRGRYAATTPTVEIWAEDDRFAPWNDDTSAVFGVHVPLQAGLLMRFCVFRVASSATDLWWAQWTGRVRRWRDQQTEARNGWRVHRVDVIDLLSELVPIPIPGLSNPGWRDRVDDILTSAGWSFGLDVYAAETEDDGGGAVPTLEIPSRDEQDSALGELDAVLDPAGLVVRTTKRGSLLVHPPPWDTFHAGKFADVGLTVTGDEWVNPLLAYYPGGVVFSHTPVDDEVGFYPVKNGASFGLDSDVEGVVNELQVTFPDGLGGTDVFAYDDPVSAAQFGRRPLPARSWLAQNDEVVESIVDAQAYTHLQAAPIMTNLDEPGTFPAIMLLDHLDPVTVKHTTGNGRQIVTADGPLRSIEHDVRIRSEGRLEWDATVLVDVDSATVAAALNPVTGLVVSALTEFQATFGWSNPAQTVTPTGTQVRVPQVSTQWLDMPYPITAFAWLGLDPDTTFRFEVRLIREVDGIVTAVSDVRSVTFTTPEATVPTPPSGGDGSVVVVTPADPGCSLEWKLDESDDGGATWTTVRSGDDGDLVFDADTDTYTLDNSDYTYLDGHIYRQCVREVCDGDPGEWECQAAPYNPLCTTPTAIGEAPFDDAVMFVPKACENEIVEAVSGETASKGPAFAGWGIDTDGAYTLTTAAVGNVVAYGDAPNVPLTDGDRSIHWRGALGTLEEVDPLLRVGRLRITVVGMGGGVFKFQAEKSFSGGLITATGSTTIVADTVYSVYAIWDSTTEALSINVDGIEEDTTVAGAYVPTPNLPTFSAKLPADSWCTELAAWDRVLESTESGALPYLDNLEGWWDFSDSATVTLDGSDLVSALADKSGNGNHMDDHTSTVRPPAPAGSPAFSTFTGDRLEAWPMATANWWTARAITIFSVAQPSTNEHMSFCSTALSDQDHQFVHLSDGRVEYGNGSSYTGGSSLRSYTFSAGPAEPGLHLLVLRIDTSGVSVRRDGVELSLTADGGTSMPQGNFVAATPGTLNARIGGRVHSTVQASNGKQAERIVYAEYLADGDVEDVEAYLMAKWGIS